jgi:hypothetical protein
MMAERLGMRNFTELLSVPSDHPVPITDQLRLAVAAYLARFKGASREHTASDLGCYLAWRAERGLDPLAARRPHLELYIRWMQEIRRFKPSTVSRRFSVVAGFYRTCVIDGQLQHSPVEHVRRPTVPAESPTLPLSTSFDAGVDLRDVQIVARHADPRTTMRSGPQERRPPPELHPGRLHVLRHLTETVSPGQSLGRRSALPNSGR